jgi:regulator of replication initiation timing
LKQYADTATDMTRLVKENDMLRLEVKNLRYQWRLVLAVLQRLQGAESLPVLPEEAFISEDLSGQAYSEDLSSQPLPNMTRFFS